MDLGKKWDCCTVKDFTQSCFICVSGCLHVTMNPTCGKMSGAGTGAGVGAGATVGTGAGIGTGTGTAAGIGAGRRGY